MVCSSSRSSATLECLLFVPLAKLFLKCCLDNENMIERKVDPSRNKYIFIHMCICIYIYGYIHMDIHVYLYGYTRIFLYLYIYIYMHLYIFMCIYIYISTDIYTHADVSPIVCRFRFVAAAGAPPQ